jgi:signal transduction histidine kinase
MVQADRLPPCDPPVVSDFERERSLQSPGRMHPSSAHRPTQSIAARDTKTGIKMPASRCAGMIRLVRLDPKLFVPAPAENLSLTIEWPIIWLSSAVQITQIPLHQPLRDVLGKLHTMGSRNGSISFTNNDRLQADPARRDSTWKLRKIHKIRRSNAIGGEAPIRREAAAQRPPRVLRRRQSPASPGFFDGVQIRPEGATQTRSDRENCFALSRLLVHGRLTQGSTLLRTVSAPGCHCLAPLGRTLRITLTLTLFVISISAGSPATAAPATSPATAPNAEVLNSAAAIRALSPEQAAQRLPVRVRGSVTYVANLPSILFIQDDTGGVCIIGPREPTIRRQLRPGALIEVEGVTAPGRLMPYVQPKGKEPLDITILDGQQMIPPRLLTLADLSSPRLHGDLIEVHGIVRAVQTESLSPNTQQDAMVLTIAAGPDRLEAAMLAWGAAQPVPKNLIGAKVRLRGVFNSAGPDKQHAAVMRLLLNAKSDIWVESAATPEEKMPATPAASLDEAASTADPRRLKLRGTVTVAIPGKGAYVQDDSAGVWVESTATPPPTPGDAVDVLGFPVRRSGSAIVEDATVRVTGHGALPETPLVTADQALSGAEHGKMISIDARVLEVSRLNEGPAVVLEAGEHVFLARLVDAPESKPLSGISDNSWVRVTGVCVNNRLPEAGGRPVSFHLMLSSPASVSVIHAPSWWTLEKVLIGAGIFLIAAVLALAWVIALRRRVAEQTTQIRQHVHQQSVNEERMRIARELHDSLEQDLLGITMQLKATEKLLDKPDRAKNALSLASAMVRRSQAETHRAVWDLRERKEGLVPTLRSAVAGLTSGGARDGGGTGAPTVEIRIEGEERELPPQTENHLLRVALESVTNAFKHAGARSVTVTVSYEPQQVRLAITDDGKGFDTDHAPTPNSGHFGLFGMRERAAKLHGKLSVESKSGAGTTIRLEAPTGMNGS